ncbi:hypothetical protein [Neptuniibacter sp. QD37_11]|uniref:hypothetical protein n=1 Tax=Neptuniibacter sp. QD37_11 TaxID=3398209 RepID=UPI0039F54079
MKNIDYKATVEGIKLGKIDVLFNPKQYGVVLDKVLPDDVKRSMSSVQKVKASKWLVGVGGVALLFTPFKLMIVGALLYCACCWTYEQYVQRVILKGIMSDEEFFNVLYENKVIALADKESTPDATPE